MVKTPLLLQPPLSLPCPLVHPRDAVRCKAQLCIHLPSLGPLPRARGRCRSHHGTHRVKREQQRRHQHLWLVDPDLEAAECAAPLNQHVHRKAALHTEICLQQSFRGKIQTNVCRTETSGHIRRPTAPEHRLRERRHFVGGRQWKELHLRLRPHRGGKMRRLFEGKRWVPCLVGCSWAGAMLTPDVQRPTWRGSSG